MLEKLIEISRQRNQKINKIEKIKPLRTADEAMQKLKEYADLGYDFIEPEDKVVFFKYFGIFDKEKPNGKNHFMLRIRIPGGQMTPKQAKKVGEVAKEYGFRDNRNKNRLHFFIQEIGMENLITIIKERSKLKFSSAGESLVELEHFDAKQGKVAQKDGSYVLHVVVPAGIFDGDSLIEAGGIAEIYGDGIRLSVDQNLYISGIKDEDLGNALTWDLFDRYKNINTPFFNHLISCPGSDTCSFGVISGKVDALEMSEYLSDTIKLEDAQVRIYWSACVKGCGIHELGDIGLLGCKAKVDGVSVPGVDIMLGGRLINESKEAKTVLKAIPIEFAKYYIEELILEYKRVNKPNESFEKLYEKIKDKTPDEKIALIVNKMIDSSPQSTEDFSELLAEINRF